MNDLHSGAAYLHKYLSHDEISELLRSWAREHGDIVRLRSLAKSLEGRDVWLLEIGRDPERKRPAICIDGNMHAAELLGSSVALHLARSLIDLQERHSDPASLPLFYVVPRLSPDGAEAVLATGRISRSAPRDRRGRYGIARWVRSDVDGDGKIRQLRKLHPAGEFVAHPDLPHVLVQRQPGDPGPFYKVFPEGFIENFDGSTIPYGSTLSDNDSDFNRSFPSRWSGEREGAGDTPGADPETRALIEFATGAPNIFVWLNLHTFGGVFIRPPFAGSDAEMDRTDLQTYSFFADIIARHTELPTISAIEEMTPARNQPMTGTLASWAYEERGCFSWAIELWDLFGAAGLERKRPFVHSYALVDRAAIRKLVEWDARCNEGRVFNGWTPVHHPQLGPVEVGGIDPVYGLINPPEASIGAHATSLMNLVAALVDTPPCLQMSHRIEPCGPDVSLVTLTLTNTGMLATSGTNASRNRCWNDSVLLEASAAECRLVAGPTHLTLAHIPGWGEGGGSEDRGVFFQKSARVADRRVTWVVSGRGRLLVRVGNERLGWQLLTVDVP